MAPSTADPNHQTVVNPIDPSFLDRMDQDFIEYYNKNIGCKPPTHTVTIADMRANGQKYASAWYQDYSNLPFVSDSKLKSDDGYEFAVRRYSPDPETSPFGKGPYPIHINFHGMNLCPHYGTLLGVINSC